MAGDELLHQEPGTMSDDSRFSAGHNPQFLIEAALAAPRPAKVEATRGDVLIGGPICRYMFT